MWFFFIECIPEQDENRVYNHEKARDPNQSPVHVHIHDDANSSKVTEFDNKDTGKKSDHEVETKDHDKSDEADGNDAGAVSGGK